MPATAKLMLIRHAEEPMPGFEGLDEHGNRDPGGLSVRGWARSGALVRLLAPLNDRFADPRLARPAAIYAASDRSKSDRPRLTVQLLAREIGRPVDLRFGSEEDPRAFVDALRSQAAAVLVAWRHQAMSPLVCALTEGQVEPSAWGRHVFDRIWLLSCEASGRWSFEDIPQRLLPGDSSE